MINSKNLSAKLKEGIGLLFTNWPVLKLALEHGCIKENNKRLNNSKEINEKKKQWEKSENTIFTEFIEETANYVSGGFFLYLSSFF
jgi:hypothetical protein